MDIDPNLVNFLVSYAANVGADATGWVTNKFRRKGVSTPQPNAAGLNLAIQAQLTATGVGDTDAEKVANYLLHTPILGYLFMLIEAGNSSDYEGMSLDDVAALLSLEAGLKPPAAQQAANVIVEAITSAINKPEFSRLKVGGTSNPRLSSIQLFGAQEAKRRLLETIGTPSPADIKDYSTSYRQKMRQKFGRIQLQHLDNGTEQDLAELYVEPDLWVEARFPDDPTMSPAALLATYGRAVIQGPAGSGKSTAVRRLASEVASWSEVDVVPLVIELRKYASGQDLAPQTFLDHLRRVIKQQMQEDPPKSFLEYLLITGRAVVFFDGLDEVLNAGTRAEVRDAVVTFAQLFPSASIVVTSRHTGYDLAPFSDSEWTHADVCELSEDQVDDYATRWFALKGGRQDSASRAASFVDESRDYASDLRVNPLMLSLLCSVYFARGDIPRTLHALYERCADMIYQQWNTMRGIEDHRAWDKDVRPLLYQVAHTLISNDEYLSNGIPETELIAEIQRAFMKNGAGDPTEASIQARAALKLWAGRAWIITPVMTDRAGRVRYGFVHQSFLEYFAAVYEVRKAESPEELYENLRDRLIDLNGWTVTQIAVSALNAWRDNGGERFIAKLLEDARAACDLDCFALLRLGISLNSIVPVLTEQLSELVEAGVRFVGRSVLLPDGEEPVYRAHATNEALTAPLGPQLNADESDFTHEGLDRADVKLPTIRSQLISNDIAEVARISSSNTSFVGRAVCVLIEVAEDAVVSAALLQVAVLRSHDAWTDSLDLKAQAAIAKRSSLSWVNVWLAAQLSLLALPEAVERVPWHALLLRQDLLLADEVDVSGPQPLGSFLADCIDDDSGYALLEHIGEVITHRTATLNAAAVQKVDVRENFVFVEPAHAWQEVRDPHTWSDAFLVAYALIGKLAAYAWNNPHAIGEPFDEDTPPVAVQIAAAAVGWGSVDQRLLDEVALPYRTALDWILTTNWPLSED